jgi:hypothetical protein
MKMFHRLFKLSLNERTIILLKKAKEEYSQDLNFDWDILVRGFN